MSELELIVLVGAQGSGKTTLCSKKHSKHLRISRDDMGDKGHFEAFDKSISAKAPLIVIDNTNPNRRSRSKYLIPAKKAGYKTKIVYIGQDREICKTRIKERKHHPTLSPNKADEALNSFFRNFQFPSELEADEVEILGLPYEFAKIKDLTAELESRRFLVVGDVHGCIQELKQMLDEREFDRDEDVLISVGDLIDRGESSKGVLDFCLGLPRFHAVEGNHEKKFKRHILGENVKIGHGLKGTIEEFNGNIDPKYIDFLNNLPLIIKTPAGYAVHAGFDPMMPVDKQNERDCVFMRYYGGKDYFDDEYGQYWFKTWPSDAPTVMFGHQPNPDGFIPKNTISLDGGCCFGGYLKAYDSRDGIVHYVSAKKEYCPNEYEKKV